MSIVYDVQKQEGVYSKTVKFSASFPKLHFLRFQEVRPLTISLAQSPAVGLPRYRNRNRWPPKLKAVKTHL